MTEMHKKVLQLLCDVVCMFVLTNSRNNKIKMCQNTPVHAEISTLKNQLEQERKLREKESDRAQRAEAALQVVEISALVVTS